MLPLSLSDDLRQNGPIISPCQSEIILEAGQNFTLTCRGKTPLNFKQQEVPEEVIGPFRIEQKNTSDLDDESMFETVLELYNVDRFAIGYYACFDDTVNGSDILNNLTEEPNNTEHIAFIYIYVAGEIIYVITFKYLFTHLCLYFMIDKTFRHW